MQKMTEEHSRQLASQRVLAERKLFHLDLKENSRGRFIKITEVAGLNRDTILIPEPCWSAMADAFSALMKCSPLLKPSCHEQA
jgi:hypothetical protein